MILGSNSIYNLTENEWYVTTFRNCRFGLGFRHGLLLGATSVPFGSTELQGGVQRVTRPSEILSVSTTVDCERS